MSFWADEKEFKRGLTQQKKFFNFLVGVLTIIGVLIVAVQIGFEIYDWLQTPREIKTADNLAQNGVRISDYSYFASLFAQEENKRVGQEEIGYVRKEVDLNLDVELLRQATMAAELKEAWYLDLNIDGNWENIRSFEGLTDLLAAAPVIWRYLLAYQSNSQVISAYDLRTLETIPILDIDQAQIWASEKGAINKNNLNWEALELVGVVNDQIYVYLHDAMNDGIIMYADYQDDLRWDEVEKWQIWEGVTGKLARTGGHNLFLEGFKDGCGEVYTFYKIDGEEERQLREITTVYNGCVEGPRFLGVDAQGRILVAPVKASALSSIDLDVTGVYEDILAIPIDDPEETVRILGSQEMPAGVNMVAFFSKLIDNEGEVVDVVLEDLIDENSTDSAAASLSARMRIGRHEEQLVLTSEESVWTVDPVLGYLSMIGRLNNMYGKVVPRTWVDDYLCLDRVGHPELPEVERLILLDVETGVANAGSGQRCLDQKMNFGPDVGGFLSKETREEALAANLILPSDWRLVWRKRDEKYEEKMTTAEKAAQEMVEAATKENITGLGELLH